MPFDSIIYHYMEQDMKYLDRWPCEWTLQIHGMLLIHNAHPIIMHFFKSNTGFIFEKVHGLM